jgi:hypothetical protein
MNDSGRYFGKGSSPWAAALSGSPLCGESNGVRG